MKENRNSINTVPDFLIMQRISFCWFITHGLTEELISFIKIQDFGKTIECIIFVEEYNLMKIGPGSSTARKYFGNYKAQLTIPIEIRNKSANNIQSQIYSSIVNLPLITNDSTFIINGCEQVVVSQIIRSPGVYFEKTNNVKIQNKFLKKLSTDINKLRSFVPSGEASFSDQELFFPILVLRIRPILKEDYYNENLNKVRRLDKIDKELLEDLEILQKNMVRIRIVPYWITNSISGYATKYFIKLKNNFTFHFLQAFKLYRGISKTFNTKIKILLIKLFFKWLKLKSSSLEFRTNKKKNNTIHILNYFNLLLILIIKYKILQVNYFQKNLFVDKNLQLWFKKWYKNKKNIFLSKSKSLKLLIKYNKLIIQSQTLIYVGLNSDLFLTNSNSQNFLIEMSTFFHLKRQISELLSELDQLKFFQKLRPTIYFSISIKEQLKYIKFKDKLKIGDKDKPINSSEYHKYLKSKTQFLLYRKDHEIKTDYNKKYDAKILYSATLIPEYGSWIRFIFKKNTKINLYKHSIKNQEDEVIIQLDRINQKPVLYFLREIGLTDLEIYKNLQYSSFFYFDQPSLITSKILNQPLSRFNLNSKYFKAVSEFSKIFDPTYYRLNRIGRLRINNSLNLNISHKFQALTYEDIFAIINKLLHLTVSQNILDDIDHLQNKRVRSIGELLQNLFRIGFQRLERTSRNQINKNDLAQFLSFSTINNAIKEFFTFSELSQYLDQTNPLSSLTHKRRLSGLGPGGLDRDRISFTMRNIHPSHYGRICPIETPEGQNVGLIASLTSHARVNKLGFLETPFWRVINGKIQNTDQPIYLTADIEDFYKIAPADIITTEKNYLIRNSIPIRYNQDFRDVAPAEVDFIAISPIQMVSIATSLIPFFEHDDANRALMGSNMQRQSVPLILPQKPIVGTGLENQIAIDSGMAVVNQSSGIVKLVTANKIIIQDENNKKFIYRLQKYLRSNQKTCINHRPIVWESENVKSGQILTDGPSITNSELSLGQNVLVGYMPWQGYNFEDAILISERLIYDNVFTSIHIERYKVTIDNDYNLETFEYITRNIPSIHPSEIKNLNADGIVKIGTFVKPEDILVGKIISNNNSEQLPESKLLRAIFGSKSKGVKDNSCRMPDGKSGRVIQTITFNRKTRRRYKLEKIYVFIAQLRKLKVGDKIAGRHGNKGIISRILSRHDMPFLPDGTPIDIILNPLGVPSRMNVGQLYECLLGLAGDKLNSRFKIIPFDEMYGLETSRILINKKLRQASKIKNESWLFNPYNPGKVILIDGRTGIEFENPVTVGNAYMLKLIHLVDDKIHARATGPYSLITQQPLRGKANCGGQRFGEMEVWALEAFGAAFTLQELLTIKSDDMEGRNKMLIAMVKGQPIPKYGIPESFKVLLSELRSIGLDISTYKIEKFSSNKNYEAEMNSMENYSNFLQKFSSDSKTNNINISD